MLMRLPKLQRKENFYKNRVSIKTLIHLRQPAQFDLRITARDDRVQKQKERSHFMGTGCLLLANAQGQVIGFAEIKLRRIEVT
jgi:hypothetical protein